MLHYIASKGETNVIKLMLAEDGIELSICDRYKFNAYGLAMREEHFEAAYMILKQPSFCFRDVKQGAGTFGSLMHLAVAKLMPDHVEAFL